MTPDVLLSRLGYRRGRKSYRAARDGLVCAERNQEENGAMTTRRIPACIFALLSAVGLLLLAHDARSQDYPPAFPREGARQVFDNMWIAAWDDTWIPDMPTPMHRHAYDYFGLELTDA